MPLIAKYAKAHKKASVRLCKRHLIVELTHHGVEVATIEAPLMDEKGAMSQAREYVYGA